MFLLCGWQDFEIGPLCLIMGDMSKSVFVAMSGGVDSSVSAYILQKAGYPAIIQGSSAIICHGTDQ